MTLALASLLLLSPANTITGLVTDGGKPVVGAIVWIDGAGDAKPIRASVVQKGKAFLPHISVVPVGSTVDFPNRDDIFHNVFAEFNAKKFDLGQYPKGQTRTVTFDKKGIVSVLCNMHSEMSAFIVVVDSGCYAVTGKDGQFSIKNVDSDSFTIEAWHESGRIGKLPARAGGHIEIPISRKR